MKNSETEKRGSREKKSANFLSDVLLCFNGSNKNVRRLYSQTEVCVCMCCLEKKKRDDEKNMEKGVLKEHDDFKVKGITIT